jgi:hypothetical protein
LEQIVIVDGGLRGHSVYSSAEPADGQIRGVP